MPREPRAYIAAIIGASQSGKSTQIKTELMPITPRVRRRLIWDFKREYQGWGNVTERCAQMVKLAEQDSFSIVFRPSFDDKARADQFNVFCDLAYARMPCTMLAEELSFVTRASWAPGPWSKCTCTGLGLGLTIIGTSQRPAQIDKNFFGNATLIRCGRLQSDDDVVTMAKALRVPQQQIRELLPYQYIERNMTTQALTTGTTRKK